MSRRPPRPLRGRGARSNPDIRYQSEKREFLDDGWGSLESMPERIATSLSVDASRSIISHNKSPDVPFESSINPYRGCEHGCIYCYARPSHAWLGLSPGLDFETRLTYKPRAAQLLRRELGRPGYRCTPIALGTNTDAYQPAERKLGITRELLQIFSETHHPCTIITKSALIERDMDLLADMARRQIVHVTISVTTLDHRLARRLEPRAAAPERRLETIRRLASAGIPVSVFVAPIIPGLTDTEMEAILERSREAGASSAAYVLLRLPLEVKGMFQEWLEAHVPLAAHKVMARVADTRQGKAYDGRFGLRMRGCGAYADLISQRFDLALRRLAFCPPAALDTTVFRAPAEDPRQMALF